mgnify:FL=1
MELRQIRYFLQIAETSSFSEASRQLCVSQSTVSQQIKQLEDELGAELFVRDSHSVKLSDYGIQFLPYAKNIAEDVRSGVARIKDVSGLSVGTINIGATYTFCPLLGKTIEEFMKEHKGISIKLTCASMEELMQMLEDGELDTVLSYRPSRHFDNIESHILFNSNLCVIARRDHPLAGKDKVRLVDLEKFPMALPSRGLQARNEFDRLLFGQNYRFDVRLEVNDLNMLLDLVSRTDMITFLSAATVKDNPEFCTIDIDHNETEMVGSYHLLKGQYIKVATRAFLKSLIENNAFMISMETLTA